MIQLPEYHQTKEQIAERIAQYAALPLKNFNEQEAYRFALSCIDLTTLEGSDTHAKIQQLCEKAITLNTAAVCVYPPFIKQAKELLTNTGITVASVAGAFPSGQSPLFVKLAEVAYAVEQGADEIDMVISRGRFLAGERDFLREEVSKHKTACGNTHLKVILETGELLDPNLIYEASMISMEAGADFIKTSTGKIQPAATLEAAYVMLTAIQEFYSKTGKKTGFKPAGGISDPETAVQFWKLVKHINGEEWLNNHMFRYGASRLLNKLLDAID